MKSQLMQRTFRSGGLLVLVLLFAGCASNQASQQESGGEAEEYGSYPGGPGDRAEGDNPYANQNTPNCPPGYTLQCEAKKVGRIRFSGFGKEDLDNCGCVPFQGAPVQKALPGLGPSQ